MSRGRALSLFLFALSMQGASEARATELRRWATPGIAQTLITGGERLDLFIGEHFSGKVSDASTTLWMGFWFPSGSPSTDVPRQFTPATHRLDLRARSAPHSVTVDFSLPGPAEITLELFDVQGRRVADLASGFHEAGAYHIADAALRSGLGRFSSGVYFVRLTAPQGVRETKFVMLR